MATSSLSLSWVSTALSKKLNVPCSSECVPASAIPSYSFVSASGTSESTSTKENDLKRRVLLLGAGALATSLIPVNPIYAEEVPKNYESFVDRIDGYSYVYPSDWRDFDFRGHDSAFKDRFMQLQNVRVRFIPTEKKDIHDLGPIDEVVYNLVKHVYAAPNQVPTIMNMQERSSDGKNYYTFEYLLTSPNYSSVSIATIAIANGRYYTQIVGANERRWKRYRNMLKVVADSFKVLDI